MDKSLDQQLAAINQGFVETLWSGMLLIAAIGVPLSVSRAIFTGWLTVYSIHVAIGLFTVVVVLLRKKIPYRWLAGLFMLLLWLIGVPGVITFGLLAASIWWLVLSSLVASTLFSVRIGTIVALGTGLVLGLAGIGFVTGHLHAPVDERLYQQQPGTWLTLLLATGSFAFIVLRTIGNRNRAILRLLGEVRAKRDEVMDLYDHAPCGYHSLDRDGRIRAINATELNWLGYPLELMKGKLFTEFLTEAGVDTFKANFPKFLAQGYIKDIEIELRKRDGTCLPVLLNATAVKDGGGNFLRSRTTVVDITERKKMEDRLDQLARTDALTGLSNRRNLYERAEIEIARSRRFGRPMSVMIVDIDRFKSINDRYGHFVGDEVLKHLSQIFRSSLRDVDLIARLGGEEFLVLMPEVDTARAVEAAKRLNNLVAESPVPVDRNARVDYTVSIGVTGLKAEDTSISELLKRADSALYLAKNGGRNQVQSLD